jgi:hypothetical protein
MSERLPDARLRFLAVQLHGLGPRPLYEYLREVLDGADPAVRLERYAALTRHRQFIAAHGGDCFAKPRVVA